MLIRFPLVIEYHPKPTRMTLWRARVKTFLVYKRYEWMPWIRSGMGALILLLIVVFLVYVLFPLLEAD